MNYETEPWIKLYVRESTEDKVLPVFNRALRDFLLRFAKGRNDPTILSKTETPGPDLARAIGAHPDETETVVAYITSMVKDGFLSHRKGRLWITNFVHAQEARSGGARRQKTYRDKKKSSNNGASPGRHGPTHTVTHSDVTVASHVTSQTIREEKKREEKKREDPDPERAREMVPGDFSDLDPNPNPEPEPDPGRETICPANLVERLENNGTVQQLAEKLAKPIDVVRDELGRFLAYWTIGKGMGQKRTAWAGKARQWVIEQAGKPGGMRAPGAIEHERRAGEYQPSASTVAALGAGLIRGMPR